MFVKLQVILKYIFLSHVQSHFSQYLLIILTTLCEASGASCLLLLYLISFISHLSFVMELKKTYNGFPGGRKFRHLPDHNLFSFSGVATSGSFSP